jgi:hypothetical protein
MKLLLQLCYFTAKMLTVLLLCSEYTTCVMEALKLEDTIKNYERCDANGW